jgi:hypothetical protein
VTKDLTPHHWRVRHALQHGVRAIACLAICGGSPVFGASMPKIDVPGIIETTRITQPDEYLLVDGEVQEEIAPDRKHFFVITARPDLQSNKVTYSLRLFDCSFLDQEKPNSDGDRAPGRVLVSSQSSENFVFDNAIRSARWMDNRTIAFLAEFEDRPTQAFAIDVVTSQRIQLTAHPSSVLGFVYSPASRVVAYVAREDVTAPGAGRSSFVAETTTLTRLIFPNDLPKQPLVYRYFRSMVGEPSSIKPMGDAFRMGRVPPLMALSPNGRWLITRSTPPSLADSLRLARAYAPLRELLAPYSLEQEDPESLFTEPASLPIMRMRIFDIASGEELPWLDVPDGTSIGREWPFAYWTKRGESVVIGNTYLPLDGVDSSERERRTQLPAVIEYWPSTQQYRKICDVLPIRLAFQGLYPSSHARDAEDAFVLQQQGRLTGFRLQSGAWIRDTRVSEHGSEHHRRGRLVLEQGSNESPEIVHYTRSGTRRVITDFNPVYRSLDLGKAVKYVWADRSGRRWNGGLLLPSDYDPTRRYPVVIQMYGFYPEQFYLDGPRNISSAMAGRAYLREGILVLAFPNDYLMYGDRREELFIHSEGVQAAILKLAADGFIDPDRVGIVGFSATGALVQHIITFSSANIRAATLADSQATTIFSATAYYYGFFKPGMLLLERRLGAQPWGASSMTWAARDPSLHTSCIEAAVRYEFYDLYPHQGWDSYVLLRRQYKPVDAIVFPRGAHQLRRPRERLDSLQGNVDWFKYWLKGEKDSDPEKKAQYERWDKLKTTVPVSTRTPDCVLDH